MLESDESQISLTNEPAQTGRAPVRSNGVGIWAFVQMFLVLALVIGSLYGVFALIKKFNKSSNLQSPNLRVLASAGLGTGKAVHVIQAGSQAFLVGAAEQGVSLIAELGDKEYLDRLALEAESAPVSGKADFASILTGLLNPGGSGRRNRAKRDGLAPASFDFLGKQRDRLKKL